MADTIDPDPPPPLPEEVAITQPLTPIPADAPPPRAGCMDKRSTLEKVLIVLAIIIIIICLGFVAAFIIFYFFSSPPPVICFTDNCVRTCTYFYFSISCSPASLPIISEICPLNSWPFILGSGGLVYGHASRLESSMDKRVDPCVDFYQYACGGWKKDHVLQPGQSLDTHSLINTSNIVKVKNLLEEKRISTDPVYRSHPKSFYSLCMNTVNLNHRGAKPFVDLAKQLGSFPVLDKNWNETAFSLERILVEMIKLELFPLVTVGIKRETDTKRKIYVDKGKINSMNFNITLTTTRDDMKTYEEWLVKLLVPLGVVEADAKTAAAEVVDFELNVTKAVLYNYHMPEEVTMTIAELQSKYAWINWLNLLQALRASYSPTLFISADDVITNMDPRFLEKLGSVISTTSKRVLSNYLLTHLLLLTPHLDANFRALWDQNLLVNTRKTAQPRWEFCVNQAIRVYPEALSRMYIDTYFNKKAMKYLKEMLDDLTVAYRDLLSENTWMTEETKNEVKTKVTALKQKVGYPDYINEDSRLNALYPTSPPSEYFETLVESIRTSVSERFKKFREPRDISIWPTDLITSAVTYDSFVNEIFVPAGILQEPLLSLTHPSSVNYGAIGMIISHELNYGLDHYDTKNDLKTWWSEKDRENFNIQADCFKEQYGCYRWKQHNLDGEKTVSRNIADNKGLKQSYRAYRHYVKRTGSEEIRLPGINLDHNQVFFLSFAQSWCGRTHDDLEREFMKESQLSPPKYRVLGALRNSQEFAEAFRCPLSSRMNPLVKCSQW
ncbi:endothelin-converting enzyme 1-like [Physella acuta]|uniref:endothelin-converting enzyme 1-like n=1 Tax=Physella acuta TaxID=109671 RepID=UPI0027DE64B2|nr:endothelin-converting enzyme 1-like [Physella acuta]